MVDPEETSYVTSRYYRRNHKFLLGLYSFSTFFFYALFILLLALNYNYFSSIGVVYYETGT